MARSLTFRIKEVDDCTIHVAKTKALISSVPLQCADQLCAFVCAYSNSRFSHDVAKEQIDTKMETFVNRCISPSYLALVTLHDLNELHFKPVTVEIVHSFHKVM